MKRYLLVLLCGLMLSGCGSSKVAISNKSNDKSIIAIVKLPNEEILELELEDYWCFSNSATVKLIDKDGTMYITNTANCTLIKED